jgi:hypothetical protein
MESVYQKAALKKFPNCREVIGDGIYGVFDPATNTAHLFDFKLAAQAFWSQSTSRRKFLISTESKPAQPRQTIENSAILSKAYR